MRSTDYSQGRDEIEAEMADSIDTLEVSREVDPEPELSPKQDVCVQWQQIRKE